MPRVSIRQPVRRKLVFPLLFWGIFSPHRRTLCVASIEAQYSLTLVLCFVRPRDWAQRPSSRSAALLRAFVHCHTAADVVACVSLTAQAACAAFDRHVQYKDVAQAIKRDYDKRYPSSGKANDGVYHAVVGKHFGGECARGVICPPPLPLLPPLSPFCLRAHSLSLLPEGATRMA